MAFISPGFALFLSIVFLLYWFGFKKTVFAQNILLLLASLYFYACYSWRFSGLLIISILINFYLGHAIGRYRNKPTGKWLLWLGLLVNLLPFLAYKYWGFFKGITSVFLSVNTSGHSIGAIDILVPLGISFYTFQFLGYLIDIYNEELEPCKNVLTFSVYAFYFPKIVAGPVEPAKKMLPQMEVRRDFGQNMITDGLRQILWGVFAKVVIANNCASFTDPLFADCSKYSGSILLLGSFLYIFQVYCDFSGYSNIAIGISKLFGLQLSRNFHAPFFSTNISEYWQKWHMTLTMWMRKYLFNPLSFTLRKFNRTGTIIAVIITFIAVGFWHGAKWTFIVFGLLHGLYFIPMILTQRRKPVSPANIPGTISSRLKKLAKMCSLFILVMLTCIFFGSPSVDQAIVYLKRIFSHAFISSPGLPVVFIFKALTVIFFILLLLVTEWIQKKQSHELQLDRVKNPYLRRLIYVVIIMSILLVGSVNHIQVLYAQF